MKSNHHPKWLRKAMADGGRSFAEKRLAGYTPGDRESSATEDRRAEPSPDVADMIIQGKRQPRLLNPTDRDIQRSLPSQSMPEADETARKMLPGPIDKNFRLWRDKD